MIFHLKWILSLIPLFFLYSINGLAAEAIKADHVSLNWLAPKSFADGAAEIIAVQFKIDPEWHIYWKNPGDSGSAPKFDFLNSSSEVGPALWPMPTRFPIGHLVNLGYEKNTAILFNVKPKPSLADSNQLQLKVKLEWLVCKESCVPGFATLTLDRPMRGVSAVWDKNIIQQRNMFLSRVPLSGENSPWVISGLDQKGKELHLQISDKNSTDSLDVFPVDGEFVNPQGPRIEKNNSGFNIIFTLAEGREVPKRLSFVVTDRKNQSWELMGTVGNLAISTEGNLQSAANESSSLLLLLFFAFIGGIILNLMPCVLPVLSIKFLSVLRTSDSERKKDALLYMLGVITTFFALGAFFLFLRSAGSAIGWGFQLQSPPVIMFLILLFWIMSLNFLGYFEFGDSVMNWAGRSSSSSSFSAGILAVFVAAPCTGPFMGTALGAASVLPTVAALGIFVSLGLGLSFPFVLVSFIPSLSKKMPKPGAWMETLKQFLAFPLLATVVWLMWILGAQLGTDGWFIASVSMLVLAMSLWLTRFRRFGIYLGYTLIFLTSFFSLRLAHTKGSDSASLKKVGVLDNSNKTTDWVPYNRAMIESARSNDQVVFIDFTAAWCITCQVNKKAVLDTEKIQALFKHNNVLIMRGDWTSQDPEITKALAEFDRNSVPLYVFYGKGNVPAQILPQILTTAMIEDLFNKKE